MMVAPTMRLPSPYRRHSHRQLACLWPVAVNRLTLPDPPCRIDFSERVSIIKHAYAIVLAMPMVKGENWNSVFPVTAMAIFIPGFLLFFAIKRRNATVLPESYIPKGLTQEQVGDVFDQIYGRHYSKSSISRMVDSVRTQVSAWLERGLESYYPVMFVDCVHIKIHRNRSVCSEAFYVVLAVTEEGRRDVLGIFNIPTESATGWGDIFDTLKERGVQKIGLMVADGIKGLDVVVGKNSPGRRFRDA